MFKLFSRNSLPISKDEQFWIDDSLIWLMNEFSTDPLFKQPILTPACSPYVDRLNSSSDFGEALLKLVCDRMGVDNADITLVPIEEDESHFDYAGAGFQSSSGASGVFQFVNEHHFRISYDTKLLRTPDLLLAVLAHEVGHVILLRDGKMSGKEEDHELMTDLVALYHGFGIFSANTMLLEEHNNTGWNSKRTGYLSMPMYSYALAVLTWLKDGTTLPDWSKHLRLNVKTWFKKSLNYLDKTGDSAFYSRKQNFDKSQIPSQRKILKKQLSLAILLEDYEYADEINKYLNSDEGKIIAFPSGKRF